MYHPAMSCIVMHGAGGISVWSNITKRGDVVFDSTTDMIHHLEFFYKKLKNVTCEYDLVNG